MDIWGELLVVKLILSVAFYMLHLCLIWYERKEYYMGRYLFIKWPVNVSVCNNLDVTLLVDLLYPRYGWAL
jgi:hypothetical protein